MKLNDIDVSLMLTMVYGKNRAIYPYIYIFIIIYYILD